MPKGQKPKPAVLAASEGNRSKIATSAFVAKNAAQPHGIGRPREPQHLSEDEQRLWREVVDSLPNDLLTRADEGVLERYVVAWQRYRRATKMIADTSLMIESPLGQIRNPLLVVQNIAAKEMHASGSELGLSPVARARLAVTDSPGNDEFSLLLGSDDDRQPWPPPLTKTRQ